MKDFLRYDLKIQAFFTLATSVIWSSTQFQFQNKLSSEVQAVQAGRFSQIFMLSFPYFRVTTLQMSSSANKSLLRIYFVFLIINMHAQKV